MKNAIALLFVLLFGACSAPSAPAYYSISSEFPADQAETIRDVVATWCEASGDCATEAMFSESAHFELVDDLPEDERTERACPEGAECVTNATEGRGRIQIARNRAPGLDKLWQVAAHEFGHVCIDGHPRTSALMAPYQGGEITLEVDDGAVEAWHAGCP